MTSYFEEIKRDLMKGVRGSLLGKKTTGHYGRYLGYLLNPCTSRTGSGDFTSSTSHYLYGRRGVGDYVNSRVSDCLVTRRGNTVKTRIKVKTNEILDLESGKR